MFETQRPHSSEQESENGNKKEGFERKDLPKGIEMTMEICNSDRRRGFKEIDEDLLYEILVYLYNSEEEVKGLVGNEKVSLYFDEDGFLFFSSNSSNNRDDWRSWFLEGEIKEKVEDLVGMEK